MYLTFYDASTRDNATQLAQYCTTAPPSYTLADNGSLSMSIELEVTPENKAYLKTIKENSHFVRYCPEQGDNDIIVGGITEEAIIDGAVCKIEVIGFKELMDKIVAYSSEKIGSIGSNTVVRNDDPSHTKNFYADNAEGVFYEILRNIEAELDALGGSKFWTYGNMEAYIESITGNTWRHVYRMNSLELPSAGEVVEDVTTDEDMAIVKVEANETTGEFIFGLSFLTAHPTRSVNPDNDNVWGLEIEKSDQVRRHYSMAAGTNLNGQTLISLVPFDSTVLKTMSVVDSPSDSVKDLSKINQTEKNRLKNRIGQASFKSDRGNVAPLNSRVTIDSPSNPDVPVVMIINQVEYQNYEYTFTGEIVDVEAVVKPRGPANQYTRNLLRPLATAKKQARRNAFGKSGTTGWRSVE